MAEPFTPQDVRDRISQRLLSLASRYAGVVDGWEREYPGQVIHLNSKTAEQVGLGALEKLVHELEGKLIDVRSGTYRYRDETKDGLAKKTTKKRPRKRS